MARYKLMGYEVQGQDENARALSLAEQKNGQTTVVYETDDRREADAIVDAGGFFRDRDNFVYVESMAEEGMQPFPQKGA